MPGCYPTTRNISHPARTAETAHAAIPTGCGPPTHCEIIKCNSFNHIQTSKTKLALFVRTPDFQPLNLFSIRWALFGILPFAPPRMLRLGQK
jgi:hypothetical protein